MIRILYALLLMSVFAFADTELAKPLPSIDNQRQILFSIKSGNEEDINHVLSTANNVLKFYGPEKVHMRIVCYYHGIKTVLKKEKKIAVRVDALQQYGVEFVACHNTMKTLHIKEEDLDDDVEVVSAGVAEIAERIKEGWIYIAP